MILPAHILAHYVWELLQNNLDMQTIDGLPPIAPIQDEMRLEGKGLPYLIYGYAENWSGGLREIRNGVFSLRITGSRSFAELGDITTVISRAFEEGDLSAANVNLFSSSFTVDGDKPFVGIRFTSLDTSYIEGGIPADDEGGPIEAVVSIDYRYITLQEVKVFNSAGNWS